MNALRSLLCATLAGVLLSGCALAQKWLGLDGRTALRRIDVVALPGANLDSATALDLVFVYDATAAGVLPHTGPEWFEHKAALLAGLATAVEVVPLQMPPSAIATAIPLPARHADAVAVYSYPNYLSTPGQAAANLTPYRCVRITLDVSTVAYRDCDDTRTDHHG